MDIVIPDNWLKDYVLTKASPSEIAKYLTLCGPSVEKIIKRGGNTLYSIEVTSNRIDCASVYGIAREVAAILPRFNTRAVLSPIKVPRGLHLISKVDYLNVKVDFNLCYRFAAVLIRNTKFGESPSWIKERLISVGIRPLNNIVDISNYLMVELGQPMHTFDYDKIENAKMLLRESKKGEQVTTLDGKTHNLFGGDIVIEDGKGRLIDLAGIMGGKLSAVDEKTRNVLLFVQTYNASRIRKTSMYLSQRTEAANIFEKDLDPELVTLAIKRGVILFEKITGGNADRKILDLYPNPYKPTVIKIDVNFLAKRLGIKMKPDIVTKILAGLGFETTRQKDVLKVKIPSWRAKDISIPEDILEEVARIYGYFNLPSEFMTGSLPQKLDQAPFDFESKIKYLLKGSGMTEVYTSSLVGKDWTNQNALKLKNPLGKDASYLRTNLLNSLISVVEENSGIGLPLKFFEMANVYLVQGKNNLPQEKMILAGIFKDVSFRKAKGIVESLLDSLCISADSVQEDLNHFKPGQSLAIKKADYRLGIFGVLEKDNLIYFEFWLDNLKNSSKILGAYRPIPKYPAQVEDLTLILPKRTKIGEVLKNIQRSKNISEAILKDIYKDAFTFTISYLNPKKTLTNHEVEELRKNLLAELAKKFGAYQKE